MPPKKQAAEQDVQVDRDDKKRAKKTSADDKPAKPPQSVAEDIEQVPLQDVSDMAPRSNMLSTFHNWKKAGKPEYLEQYQKASREEKNVIYQKYQRDKKCTFMFSGVQQSSSSTQLEKSVMSDWLTLWEIGALEKIPTNHPDFMALCEAVAKGCDERLHEKPELASLNVKQFAYSKKLANKIVERKKDEMLSSSSGNLSEKQHKEFQSFMHGESSAADVQVQVLTKSVEQTLKEQVKVYASAEKAMSAMRNDAQKLMATLKHCVQTQPLLQSTIDTFDPLLLAFGNCVDELVNKSAAMSMFDPTDPTGPIAVKNAEAHLKDVAAKKDEFKKVLAENKKWIPSNAKTA